MEHAEASESMAAERYLLNEMTPEDREAFEEHFFGCAECAAAVRDGAAVAAAIRVDRVSPARRESRRFSPWWAVAAAAILLVAGLPILQNIRLRRDLEALRTPHLVDSVSFLTAGTRGGAEPTIAGAARPFMIDFDVVPQANAERYVVRVLDDAGRVRSSLIVTPDAARDTQHLFFPPGALKPGRYSLEIRAEPAEQPPTAWSFVVR